MYLGTLQGNFDMGAKALAQPEQQSLEAPLPLEQSSFKSGELFESCNGNLNTETLSALRLRFDSLFWMTSFRMKRDVVYRVTLALEWPTHWYSLVMALTLCVHG